MKSLKFRDEGERRELVRLHAEVYRRARHGEINLDEAMRQSLELQRAHKALGSGSKRATKAALTEGNR